MRILIFLLFTMSLAQCGAKNSFDFNSDDPPSHGTWTKLLEKYVTEEGYVDYEGFQSSEAELDQYLASLSNNPPNEKRWSREEQLAFWINAYNAFTIKLILNHYPVASIKDIAGGIPFVNTPWDIKFVEIGGEKYDLNNIEHGIIRKKFDEPLIHIAVNCASVSCPRLRTEAYEAERLEEQLKDQASYFINESGKNKITPNSLQLSRLLKWYGGDFKDRYGNSEGFVKAFSKQNIEENPEVDYLEYNWTLNTAKNFAKAGL